MRRARWQVCALSSASVEPGSVSRGERYRRRRRLPQGFPQVLIPLRRGRWLELCWYAVLAAVALAANLARGAEFL